MNWIKNFTTVTIVFFFITNLLSQKVGIGTTTPTALLDVAGDALINSYNAGRGNGNINTNTVFGGLTLNSNTTGFRNTAFGRDAMRWNTTGRFNTATGSYTLLQNTSGDHNSGFGNSALGQSSTGSWNTAFGSSALYNTTTGSHNTALGYLAGNNNIKGSNNLFVGSATNISNDSLVNASAIGYRALVAASNSMILGSIAGVNGATSNTWVGIGTTSPDAMLEVTSDILINTLTLGRGGGNKVDNTAIGNQSLKLNTTGTANSAIGFAAMLSNQIGTGNTSIGAHSLVNNQSGNNNNALGYYALSANTIGSSNVAIGKGALYTNISGSSNTALGHEAGLNNTGSNNVFIGAKAEAMNPDLTNATAIGYRTPVSQSNTLILGSIQGVNGAESHTRVGIGTTEPVARLDVAADIRVNFLNIGRGPGNFTTNTVVGNTALQQNTMGDVNTAMGFAALLSNQSGHGNTAVGSHTLSDNTNGNLNNAFGLFSLTDNVSGSYNVAMGTTSLYTNVTGSYNTAMGYQAGYHNTGSKNLFAGYAATTLNGNVTNASAIGPQAAVATSNSMILGSIAGVNGATNNTNVGIGTTSPTARLHVEGDLKIKQWHQESLTDNGYVQMGSLLIQWGSVPYKNNDAKVVNFPLEYDTVFSLTANVDAGDNSGSGANVPVKVLKITDTKFEIAGTQLFTNDNASLVRWMAIGIPEQ